MDDKKLFLLDAYALIYRAYYALIRAPRVTSGGLNTSAIYGFCNTLDEILKKENPSHIAVCFDPPHGVTFRHEVYPEYKAQRDAQPEDITLSIPYIKRIIEAYNIPVVEIPGFEADDVIGTLARHAQESGFTTFMMTPDKDYGQLVTDHTFMYRPALKGQGFEIRGPREVCERYGIDSPRQVIDLLALEGDVSDNVPGCPGVGEKTASKLIKEWGSVENLLDHVDDLKGALQKKIRENAEQIRFSKFLVTIKTDVPVDITVDSLERKPENVDALREIYKELEFRTFLSRLEGNIKAPVQEVETNVSGMGSLFDEPASAGEATTTAIQVETLESPLAVGKAVEKLAGKKLGLFMNAKGAESMTAGLKGIAISDSPEKCVYIPVSENKDERREVMAVLEPLFTDERTIIVSHDVKRDLLLLKREGVEMTCAYEDTGVLRYIIDPERRFKSPEGGVSPESAAQYATAVLESQAELAKRIEADGLTVLYNDIELPMVKVLAGMEWNGVRIDTGELSKLSQQLTERLQGLEEEAYRLAGTTFNLSSPMQVGEVLFERLKIDPKAKRTKRGAYSTTEEILEKYRNSHPVVDIILQVRGLRKLLTTYINALPQLINPLTGKIHTTYNQTVTATGRLSSTNPNLQNIPVRTDLGREIRRAFIPDEGDLMLSADYSQIELRLMAELSRDPDMVDAFATGKDIHRATAAKIYHKALEEVSDTERRNAKTANFGIIYGISAFGLSERLGISRSEAKMLIDGYFSSYPHIRDYINNSIEKAREQGYVTTVMGRKRMLPDINSRNAVVRGYAERNAVNAPLQGSAADIIKIAMINIADAFRKEGLRSTMIMQVHDELIFNVKPDELEHVKELVVRLMEGAFAGSVRLEVSAGVASNWLEAH